MALEDGSSQRAPSPSKLERRAREEVEDRLEDVKDAAARLKACLELLQRVREAMGEDLEHKAGPPPPSVKELGEAPCATFVSPEDKAYKLSLDDLAREAAEGFTRVPADNVKRALRDLEGCVKRAERECLSYLESAVDIMLADEEAVLRPFKDAKPFGELLAKVSQARAMLPSSRDPSTLRKALDLALAVREAMAQLRPKAVHAVKEAAAHLLSEAPRLIKQARDVGVELQGLEERVEEASKLRSLDSDTGWEALSYYMNEVEEALRQLAELREGVSRVEELKEIKDAADYVASKLPELRPRVAEARAKVDSLLEAARHGGAVSREEVEDLKEEVEEAFLKAGAGRVARDVKDLYREVRGELGRRGVACVVEEPPSDLKKGSVLPQLREVAKCKDELEGLLKTMAGSQRTRSMPVAELRKNLLESVKSEGRRAE